MESLPATPKEMIDPYEKARHREFVRVCQENDWPWVSDDLDKQESYLDMRIDGQSHNMAEILALRKFPATRTDREWNMGHCNGSQFDGSPSSGIMGNYYKRIADKAGVSVTGKVYKSGLADFPGDPRAWVSDRHDAKALLEERGWSSQGLVNVKGVQHDQPDVPLVDPALISKEVAARAQTGQMLGCRDQPELADKLNKIRAWKPDHEIGRQVE